MPRPSLLQALGGQTLLCDGATGTELQKLGLAFGACGELWNVQEPERVRRVHRSYLDAGCVIVTTNTFGGTAATLGRHGLAARVRELNLAGARLAMPRPGRAAGSSEMWGPAGSCWSLWAKWGRRQLTVGLPSNAARSSKAGRTRSWSRP